MKQILFLITLFFSFAICAQNEQNPKVQHLDFIDLSKSIEKSNSSVSQGDSIGFTVHDWQSNNSMQRRLFLEKNGTLHAAWTFGVLDPSFTDRGTGYNVRKNGIWGNIPTDRLENLRTGWPDLGQTTTGRIYSLTHSSNGLNFIYKDLGSTIWTNTNIPNDTDALWPRTATDNNAIYTIASRQNAFGGLSNGLAFHRSIDGGDTWQGPFTLPMLTQDYGGVTIDCYDIDAAGGTLAMVLGGYGRQTIVYKSTDGGDTWESIPLATTTAPLIVNGTTPVPEFAPVSLADNVSIVVDDNGQIHVAGAWIFNYTDAPNTAPSFSPNHGGILYWTEGMAGMELIGNTVAQDWDGNGSNEYDAIDQATGNVVDLDVGWRFYSNVPVAMPSIAVDEIGNPFIAYASVVDAHFHNTNANPIERYFREIFVVKNTGNGWEGPYNVSDDENTEDVFPSLPTRVYGGEVNILYMSDSEAGTEGYTNNGIKVVTIDADDIIIPDYIAANNGPSLGTPLSNFETTLGCAINIQEELGIQAWDFPDGDLTEDIVFPIINFDSLSNNTIVFSVSDSDGNTVQDTVFLSIIQDNTPPEITLLCPDGTPGCENQLICPGVTEYEDPGFTFYDNSECPGLDQSAVVVGGDVVDVNTEGVYEITYEAQDFAGNPVSVVRTVVVVSDCGSGDPPTITVIAPDGSNIQDGDTYVFEADASLTEIAFFVEATDNVTPNVDIDINYGENGAPDPTMVGDYVVTISATDEFGNTTTLTYVISVVDTTPPTIELSPDFITEYAFCLGEGTIQSIADDITVSDNMMLDPVLNTNGDVDFNEIGIDTVSYTYTDESGNVSDPIEIIYTIGNEDDCWAVGIDEIDLNKAITISPNPSSEMAIVRIDGDYQSLNISLLDVQGKEMMTLDNQNNIIQLDLSKMVAGVYYVKVKTEDATAVERLIVE